MIDEGGARSAVAGPGADARPARLAEPIRVGAALVLLLVVALAMAVRLPGMDHRLLPDEGYTWLVASASGAGDFLHRLAAYENTPPLYYRR